MFLGTATANLSKIAGRFCYDRLSGKATARKDDLEVIVIKDGAGNFLGKKLKISTLKLLDICTIKLTAQNSKNNAANTAVFIDLDEYMRFCGIPLTKPFRDKTRNKVNKDLTTLWNMRLKFYINTNKGKERFDFCLLQGKSNVRNGVICAWFTDLFAQYLIKSPIMQYHLALLKMDERNSNSYHMGKALLRHQSTVNNHKRGTQNIISVKALLAYCSDIPDFETVRDENRSYKERIIKPFEIALDRLDFIQWNYCNSKKTPLTQEQKTNFNYDVFINCYIHFELTSPLELKQLPQSGDTQKPN